MIFKGKKREENPFTPLSVPLLRDDSLCGSIKDNSSTFPPRRKKWTCINFNLHAAWKETNGIELKHKLVNQKSIFPLKSALIAQNASKIFLNLIIDINTYGK